MFVRYIIDFFSLSFSRCKYVRKNYFSNVLLRKKYPANSYYNNFNTDLDHWINKLKGFSKIVVLGSGPSLNKLKKFNNNTLYLTTNASVCAVLNHNFVYLRLQGNILIHIF